MAELMRSWAFWAVVGLVVLMFAVPAKASPVGATGVFCDTKEQVGQFIDAIKVGTSPPEAVETINKAVGSATACVLSNAIVVDIQEVEKRGDFTIVKVTVVAVMIPQPTPVPPIEQFFALRGAVKPVSTGTDI